MIKEIKQNLIIYVLFLFIALTGIYYGNAVHANFKFIRIWNFTDLVFLLIGIPFLFFQTKAKLPNFWQKDSSILHWILLPLLTGILFGVFDVLVFKVILHPEPYQELPPFLQPFPYSIFIYFSGAFEVEVFYRLIPLTLILLLGNWFMQGKYYLFFFRAGALLTAIREPLEQLPQGGILLVVYAFLTGFLMNLVQAVWYRKAGFLASLSLRLGHYFIWHILLGIYVEYFELMK